MITSYLQGGLGNQMFQIAAAYSHAKKNNDTAYFNLSNSHTPLQGENVSKYKDNLLQFNHMDNIYEICNKVFSQPSHSYCEIPYEPNQQLHGYYQSEKFFIDDKDELIEKFRLGLTSPQYINKWDTISKELGEIRKQTNKPIVSIHVRRGDYLKNPDIHPPCPINYYNEAISIIESRIGCVCRYFVSDDIEWCKENFSGTFSDKTDEIDDLMIMVNSDHNVIANSTFSWWGAYLNTNPKNITVGPNKWFGPRGPQDTGDILPEKWNKV
jgi:hypothetical protein